MNKIKHKRFLVNILMFSSFFLLATYMHLFTHTLLDLKPYHFEHMRYMVLWFCFSISWICFFLSIINALPKKARVIVYGVLEIFWIGIFVSQICYVQQMGKFMVVSDLFVAGEGLQYIKVVFLQLKISMVLTAFIALGMMAGVFLLEKKIEDKPLRHPKGIVFAFLFLAVGMRILSMGLLGSPSEENTWKENYTAKNIYINFTNPNTSMYITGLYEYNIRSVYKYFHNLLTLDKAKLKSEIDEYNKIYGMEKHENEYTGLLKGKNVIYVMMESIDSWIIDEETMPTLKHLQETGIDFSNRYSPFFNGGQTINSEFALNSGMYAISNKETIYDIDDVDYTYSLANMLKKNGYAVNSFHANSGSFYNRSTFHKRLGYTNHYSAYDMQKAGLLDSKKNYYADSIFLGEKELTNLMLKDTPFLAFYTTYSAHLEYTASNKVYKSIKHPFSSNKYTEEEFIYRTLVHDTDEALRELIETLEEKNLLENTVLVLVSDHYVYGYSDSAYVAAKKNVLNDRKELQNTPFIIWSKEMEPKKIETIVDTADILPTMLNLLGIEYNPNYYMGTDIFSDHHDDFVWFSDGSYIKSKTCALSDEAILTKSNYNIKKNKDILLTNYYGKS